MKNKSLILATVSLVLSACTAGGSIGTGGIGASVGASLDNIGTAISNTFGEKQTVKIEQGQTSDVVKAKDGNAVVAKANPPRPLTEKEYAEIKAKTEKSTTAVEQVKVSASNVADKVLTKGESVTQATTNEVKAEVKAVAGKAIDKGVTKITAPLQKGKF